MKKIFALILALTMVFALAACGGETAPETTAPAANVPGKTDPSSWKYTVRGVDVMMNAEAAPVLEALGEPVSFTEDIFEALDIQDDLQTRYTSGTVFHAFLGEKMPDWESAATLVRKIAENYKLPYYTLSPT